MAVVTVSDIQEKSSCVLKQKRDDKLVDNNTVLMQMATFVTLIRVTPMPYASVNHSDMSVPVSLVTLYQNQTPAYFVSIKSFVHL